MLSPRVSVLAITLALISGGDARADNPHLEQARAQKLALDYQAGLASLAQALALGDSSPRELTEIYRLAGELEAGLGRIDAATEQFKRLLMLDPSAELPPGTSPKLTAPFERARRFAASHPPLAIHQEEIGGATPAVIVVVDSDPLAMVVGAGASYRIDPSAQPVTIEASGTRRIELVLPPADRISLLLWVFDSHGNRLAIIGDPEPLVITRSDAVALQPIAEQPVKSSTPLYRRWWVWGGCALVTASLGGYFGLAMQEAERDLEDLNQASSSHSFAEAEAIEDRGRRSALLANVSFAIAGGSALIATMLLWRDSKQRRAPRRLVVTPALTGDGAGLVFAGGF